MEDKDLAVRLWQPAQEPRRAPGWRAPPESGTIDPREDHVLYRLERLHEAYAGEDAVPDRLTALARMLGEVYESCDGNAQQLACAEFTARGDGSDPFRA